MPQDRTVKMAPKVSTKAAWLESYESVGCVRDDPGYAVAPSAAGFTDGSATVSSAMFSVLLLV